MKSAGQLRRLLSFAGPLVLCLGLPLAASFAAAADLVSEKLVVAGAVKTPLALGVDDLKAFPAEQITTVSVTRRVDGKEIASTARGVRLSAVLDRAGLAAADANDWKHTVVLATATDGYRVVFSWPELFNGEGGASVLVVFERDGAPLGEREGRIAMIAARDLKTGPRSVRWLNRLDVRVLRD
jgi:DMSO/TMAO reductase YedYZ molybdopterin-dependent catalytic subunit